MHCRDYTEMIGRVNPDHTHTNNPDYSVLCRFGINIKTFVIISYRARSPDLSNVTTIYDQYKLRFGKITCVKPSTSISFVQDLLALTC